jgi:hypothetical protein
MGTPGLQKISRYGADFKLKAEMSHRPDVLIKDVADSPSSTGNRPNRLGSLQSMSRPGKMSDNAHIESFLHSRCKFECYSGLRPLAHSGELKR